MIYIAEILKRILILVLCLKNHYLNIKLNEKNKNINESNKNYIISKIDIKAEDIGKQIRIISSFEEGIRTRKIVMDEKEYNKY